VVDVFYVTDSNFQKIEDKQRLSELCEMLTMELTEDSEKNVASF